MVNLPLPASKITRWKMLGKDLKVMHVGKNVLFDYAGMNPATAKIFGFTEIADDEVLVISDDDVQHERNENDLVNSGMAYWPAHTKLLKEQGDYKTMTKTIGNLIRKSVSLDIRKGADGQNEICISTPNYDRGNDRVFPKGGMLDNYLKNPIIMWLHDYHGETPAAGIPVATCPYLKITDEGIISGEPQFLEGDPFAQRVKNAWDKGFLKTASIGFLPIDYETNEKSGTDYKTWEMLEWSLVPIPMNAEAMRIAKGFEDLIEIILKPEETENYFRVPVPKEAGKHDGHRIRTIEISAKEGIKALYCGECKVNITYLFDKNHDWTMAKAEAWVKEHSKSISQAEIADALDYTIALIKAGDFNEDNIKLVKEIGRLTGNDIPDEDMNFSQLGKRSRELVLDVNELKQIADTFDKAKSKIFGGNK